MKSYLTEEQITYFVKRGNSIVSGSDFRAIHAIAKKYNFELTGSKQVNAQMYYNAIVELREALPANDSFKANLIALREWGYRDYDNTVTMNLMRHLGIYESEFQLFTSSKWDELYSYVVCELGSAGVNTDGGIGIFIKNKGDYYGYLNQYSKKYADPESLKSTTNLMNTLEGITAGFSNVEKANLASVVNQYITAFDRPLDFDTLHNLLYKGQ